MQPAPDGPDYCLTPRLEAWVGGQWYSNLFHPGAKLSVEDGDCVVEARLVNARQEDPPGGPLPCRLRYRFTDLSVTVEGQVSAASPVAVALVLPVIATDGETLRRISSRKVELKKAGGILVIEGAGPVDLAELGGQRVFNLVPGFCAAPVRLRQPLGERGVACTLHVRPSGAG